MILNTETTDYGYRVSARGALRAEGATAWLEALKRRLDEETTGFGLVIDVRRPDGRSVMLPFDDITVTEVDSDGGRVVVDPVEGLLD